MFVLTLEDHPDGVFSVFDSTDDRVIPIFLAGDDAERYLMMMEEDDRTNGEFYLAPVYNYLMDPIKTFHVEKFIGLGTPEELEDLKQSEWWDKLDRI